jgi:hypothetical protein
VPRRPDTVGPVRHHDRMDTTLPPVGEPVGPALPIGTQVVLREPLDDLVGTRAQRGATGTVTSLAGGR